MENLFANIIVDLTTSALNKSFIYRVPNDLIGIVKPGDKVLFPFGNGNKEREGFVLEILTLDQLKNKNFYKNDNYFKKENAIDDLKEIKSIKKTKITLNEILLKIAIYLCKEYYCPIQICLNTVLPVKKIVRKNKRQVDAITKYNTDINNISEFKLNDEQQNIVNNIINKGFNSFSEHLIFGITGSGKTEVYIKVIEKALSLNKQIIVLIPEIALTHQTVIRLKERFNENISIIHSRMSEGEKYIQYKKCESGETNILVGPRSAIFAPFENLGLVVVDEVDDPSYKSETSPRYKTLDVARFRCKEQNAMIISLSATPNVNLYYEANLPDTNINLHKLTNRAVSSLPNVIIVDMKKEIKSGNKSIFSKMLVEKIKDRLSKNEQIMLYMNRRGYNTIFTCKECGYTYKCPHCDVALVSHYDGKLKCHYCGYEVNEPLYCPNCNSDNIEKYGLGTEKLEEECISLFPNARILRMDKDTTMEKDGHDKIIAKFRNHEADILIGTQMIIKGHDFKDVTLVAVMRADLTLYAETYKSSENTFAMLTQCVGRSGRKNNGESIIQGFDVDNPVIQFVKSQNYEDFYKHEIEYRNKLKYPPFSKLLYIRISSTIPNMLDDISNDLKYFIDKKNDTDATILGPTKMNPEKVKDTYYKRIIIKCKTLDEAKRFRNLCQNYISSLNNIMIRIAFDIE